VSRDQVEEIADEEIARLGDGYEEARELFEEVATGDTYAEFLTVPAYAHLP
jgi:malate synthase